jgi:hypothetical protein
MSPIKLILSTTLIILQSIPLYAEDFYYGASIGYGSLNENPPNTDPDAVASDITAPEGLNLVGQPTATFDYHIDDRDMNWNLFGGYNFNRYLSVEAGYMNFGKSIISSSLRAEITTTLPDPLTGTQTSDATLTSQISTKTSGFHIKGIARYPFMDKFNTSVFSVYGELGAIMWDTNIDIRQTFTPFSLQTTADDDAPDRELRSLMANTGDNGINFLFGLGADYRITTDIGIRAGWSYYRGIDNRNIQFFSIGAFYLYTL